MRKIEIPNKYYAFEVYDYNAGEKFDDFGRGGYDSIKEAAEAVMEKFDTEFEKNIDSIHEGEQLFIRSHDGSEYSIRITTDTEIRGYYTVCVVFRDLAYGGPEEGGWYYSTTVPVTDNNFPVPQNFTDLKEAKEYEEVLWTWCRENYPVKYPISSVLSEGEYGAEIYDRTPHAIPESVPHYS